jgi:hypothetical protein
MPKKKITTFKDATARTLVEVASEYRGRAKPGVRVEQPELPRGLGRFIAKPTATIDRLDDDDSGGGSGDLVAPPSGEVEIWSFNSDNELVATGRTVTAFNVHSCKLYSTYFVVLENIQGRPCIVSVLRRVRIGKTDGTVTAGGTGTVSIWSGSTLADTGDNLSNVKNQTSVEIGANKFVRVEEIDGVDYMEPWEC